MLFSERLHLSTTLQTHVQAPPMNQVVLHPDPTTKVCHDYAYCFVLLKNGIFLEGFVYRLLEKGGPVFDKLDILVEGL
jgi:hypothetical protein